MIKSFRICSYLNFVIAFIGMIGIEFLASNTARDITKLTSIDKHISIICVVSAWGMTENDVLWLESLPYPIVAYSKELRPTVNDFHRTEAGKYAHFLCNNYDFLPDLVIFLHGHATAWHRTPEIIIDLINKIEEGRSNPKKLLTDFAYFSFSSVVWSEEEFVKIFPILNHTWIAFLGKHFVHPLEDYGDFIKGNKCCSEFIVSSARIRTRPRELWCDFFHFLNTAVGVRMIVPVYKDLSDEKVKGMIFEWFVPLLFGPFQ